MLKRIALATVLVVSAAFAGVGVAKAQSGSKKGATVTGTVTTQGFHCYPGGGGC